MSELLRNGTHVDDVRLDRLYELDWRSLDYPVTAQIAEYRPRSFTWRLDERLDQGREGACVGFAFAHELAARPAVVQGVTDSAARRIYKEAQKIDPWPGEAYEGTSVLAGAKVCQTDGFFESYHWALTAEDVARGIAYFGPCVLGLNWYEGQFSPDPAGFIRPTGRLAGGHAIVAVAVKVAYKSVVRWRRRTWLDVDHDRSYITLVNSWGPGWGDNGKAKLTLTDLARLLAENGDAVFPKRTDRTTV